MIEAGVSLSSPRTCSGVHGPANAAIVPCAEPWTPEQVRGDDEGAGPVVEPSQAGFTLLELMISLGLFALIAVAGLTLVDSVIGVDGRTEARLDRVADLQRAMVVISSDLDQIAPGPLAGDAAGVRFARAAPGFGGPAVPVAYRVVGGRLERIVGGRPQQVLDQVTGARWRYFDGGWLPAWPPAPDRSGEWPRAVVVELQLGGTGGGVLRRIVTLPVPAQPS
ncbi:type II secretion system protein GspJ [Sphingomonas sp. Leaf25]|uniref:type II secretion system protein GspJ n=1 Tax=Sphingomonas sp. Leaf25 TaxID=1735692 RepID=UPI0009E9145C|nr:type II secretion system protein GspJ [Sphingomonas sp. Leaf25]